MRLNENALNVPANATGLRAFIIEAELALSAIIDALLY